MERILVSACLLGEKVRYDGAGKTLSHDIWQKWQDEGRLVSICPEVSGGLPVPRLPAEMADKDTVINAKGEDVTDAFIVGAEQALRLTQKHNIHLAVLKENSPSCGSHFIYDGTFSGTKKTGQGITAALLLKNGIKVFSENELEQAQKFLKTLGT